MTANSMYGCLGFSHSRFFAQPIAAMVTSMGRQTLQKTVEIAQASVGLEVIYGDTDSIMINTRISDQSLFDNVTRLGEQVKREVNKLYKTLELEIDGVFKSMLLLKKKKYAAVTVERAKDGKIVYGREQKGLDLVRRDWCVQSRETGKYVLDQILSGNQEKDVSVSNVLAHLEVLAQNMRESKIPLEKFVITKGLSKHPNDYPDGKSLPHVHVAKMMLKNKRRLNVGDHIPYVITEPLNNEADSKAVPAPAERARHPDEIVRSAGVLKPDVEWYLQQQIMPPVSRLCECIDGLSQGLLAQSLGLDSTKYNQSNSFGGGDDIYSETLVNYIPESHKKDSERFHGVKKLSLTCAACGVENEFPGWLYLPADGSKKPRVGYHCVNPDCEHQYWGECTRHEFMARVVNGMTLLVRHQLEDYYKRTIQCDDPICGLKTRQLSVNGGVCLSRGCNGQMRPLVGERILQKQLKYLECLFDKNHVSQQLMDSLRSFGGSNWSEKDVKLLMKNDEAMSGQLHVVAKEHLNDCGYNWISPSFWNTMFAGLACKQ